MKKSLNLFCATTLLAGATLLGACNSQAKNQPNTEAAAVATTTQNSDDAVAKALQDNLKKANIELKVTSAIATKMPNIYLASFDKASTMFTDKTGTYLIQGQIVQLGDENPVDIAAELKSSVAKQLLAQADTKQMIVFAAQGEKKAAIYVFTDPTCVYCQKLHKEIDAITAGGIEVRYLAWPRTDAAKPLTEAIWCSQDKQAALTAAKQGKLAAKNSCDNPVEEHLAIGHQLGITGTPAVFTESGLQIGGYLPSKELIELAIKNQ